MSSQSSQGGGKIRVSVQKAGPLDTGEIAHAMKTIKTKFAIMSGKGGVGKSFVTASLALGFAMRGYRVGVLDADVYAQQYQNYSDWLAPIFILVRMRR